MENIRAEPGPMTDAPLRLVHHDGAHTPDRAAAHRRARHRDGSHHAEPRNKDDADLRDHGFQPWGRLEAPVSQGDRGGSKLGGTGENKTIIYFEAAGRQQLSSRVCQVPNLHWADVDSPTDVR